MKNYTLIIDNKITSYSTKDVKKSFIETNLESARAVINKYGVVPIKFELNFHGDVGHSIWLEKVIEFIKWVREVDPPYNAISAPKYSFKLNQVAIKSWLLEDIFGKWNISKRLNTFYVNTDSSTVRLALTCIKNTKPFMREIVEPSQAFTIVKFKKENVIQEVQYYQIYSFDNKKEYLVVGPENVLETVKGKKIPSTYYYLYFSRKEAEQALKDIQEYEASKKNLV